MRIKYPCTVCGRSVAKKHKALQCDYCDQWVHIKCNLIDKKTYDLLKQDESPWSCIKCTKNIFPFMHDDPPIKNHDHLTTKQQEIIKALNQTADDPDNLSTTKYYTPDEFYQNLSFSNRELLMLHLNIASLPFHVEDLHNFLVNMSTKPSIIGISESKLKKDNPSLINISLPDYNIEQTDTESASGGTLLYISKSLNYINRQDLNLYKSKELETTFIEVILPKRERNLIVGTIYRHPCMDTDEFNTQYLPKLLSSITKEIKHKDFILMGDFNIDLLNYSFDNKVAEFLDKMYSSSLLPLITHPTRISKTSQTLIDNIFSTIISDESKTGNITTVISDHFCQFVSLPISEKTDNDKEQYGRNFRNLNKGQASQDINNINWAYFLELGKRSPNLSLEKYLTQMNSIIDKHLPLKKLSKQDILQREKPWMTKGLIKSIKVKNVIHGKMRRAKDLNRKEDLFNKYKTYKNKITKLTRLSKANHFNQFFIDNKANLLKVWQGVKSIINTKPSKNKQNITTLKINDKIISDKKNIAETMNKFFTDIPKKIESKIKQSKKDFRQYLGNPSPDIFILNQTNPKEVELKIGSLKNNKTNGPNSLPTKFMKEFKKEISIPLSLIINLSFSTGIFPNRLKLANIFPIHKSGDKDNCNNYRPIALLSNISKIIEKLVHTRLYFYLEKNSILYKHQYGFRLNHSTTHALIATTEEIRNACDNGKYACIAYLDLKKAFDTVNHNVLLEKMSHYGIKGITSNWFRSYLVERNQYTTIGDYHSTLQEIYYGVPQGSVLGPLLFILYINDLHQVIQHCSVFHYADDTNLLLINKSLKTIVSYVNHDLALITDWLRANKISLNTSKTKVLIYKPKTVRINKKLNFRISGQKVEISDSIKYLGLHLKDTLEWDNHLKVIIKKLQRAIGILSKIRHYVPKWLLRTIYFSLFNSHLIYGCEIWGQRETGLFRNIQDLQDKAIRIINFKLDDHDVNSLYHENKILKITDFIALKNTLFVKDSLEGNTPTSLQNIFKLAREMHNHGTRNARNNLIDIPQVRTQTYGHFSIKSRCATIWNTLQNTLDKDLMQISHSYARKALIEYFLNTYI